MCKLETTSNPTDSTHGAGADQRPANLSVDMTDPKNNQIALNRNDSNTNSSSTQNEQLHFDDPYQSACANTKHGHHHHNDGSDPAIKDLEQKLKDEIHLLDQLLKELSLELHSHDKPHDKPPVKQPAPHPPEHTDKPPVKAPPETIPIHSGHITNPDALAAMREQNDFNGRGVHKPPHSVAPGKYGTGDGHSEAVFPNLIGFRQWGVIMAEDPDHVNPNVKSSVRDAAVYYHLKTGGWVQAKSPEDKTFWQGNYWDDFHGHEPQHGDWKRQADGSFQFSFAPKGMLNHFGPGEDRIPYDPNLYDGVYDTMAVKSNLADSGLVMQLGGDWLRSTGISQNNDGYQPRATVSNPAAGGTNWMPITDKWQKLYYTSLPMTVIESDPPPGL